MDKFYNKISQHLLTKLKEIYPNGYDVGVIVSVPVNSVAITHGLTHALIDGNYKDYWAPYGVYLDVLCIDKKGYREQITWRAKDIIDGKRKYKYHSALSE